MVTGKQSQILNASSNLIGICFVIVAGLKITGMADRTLCDEICMVAAFFFLCACILSYVSMRTDGKGTGRLENLADYTFLASLILLFTGVALFARDIL